MQLCFSVNFFLFRWMLSDDFSIINEMYLLFINNISSFNNPVIYWICCYNEVGHTA